MVCGDTNHGTTIQGIQILRLIFEMRKAQHLEQRMLRWFVGTQTMGQNWKIQVTNPYIFTNHHHFMNP